jgi:hypothetical protein
MRLLPLLGSRANRIYAGLTMPWPLCRSRRAVHMPHVALASCDTKIPAIHSCQTEMAAPQTLLGLED